MSVSSQACMRVMCDTRLLDVDDELTMHVFLSISEVRPVSVQMRAQSRHSFWLGTMASLLSRTSTKMSWYVLCTSITFSSPVFMMGWRARMLRL